MRGGVNSCITEFGSDQWSLFHCIRVSQCCVGIMNGVAWDAEGTHKDSVMTPSVKQRRCMLRCLPEPCAVMLLALIISVMVLDAMQYVYHAVNCHEWN